MLQIALQVGGCACVCTGVCGKGADGYETFTTALTRLGEAVATLLHLGFDARTGVCSFLYTWVMITVTHKSICFMFGHFFCLFGVPAVSFDDLMKSTGQQQQQQQQQGTGSSPEPRQPPPPQQQQQGVAPGALMGSFQGSASQVRPIPPHVLDQEYDMVHQVGGGGEGPE